MNKAEISGFSIQGIYGEIIELTKKDFFLPAVFMLIAILDLLALMAFYLAPSAPFSLVLAPIIRTFWGERFLHYPQNFLLLPKLLNHAHFVITTFVGVFLTGIVMKKVEGILSQTRVSALSSIRQVWKRYLSMMLSWVFTYFTFALLSRIILPVFTKSILLQLGIIYLLGLFLQSLFAYLMPAMLLVEGGLMKRIKIGFLTGFKNLGRTSVLFSFPIGLMFASLILKLFVPLYVQIYPELVLGVLVLCIGITTAADFLVTMISTTIFLKGENRL